MSKPRLFRTSNGNCLQILDSQRRNNVFCDRLDKIHITPPSEKSFVDKFQTKGLIILVIIILGAEVFVTITRGVLLEEAGKVFQVFLLVSFEVASHYDDAPVRDAANTTTVFPETDV